MVGQRHFVSQGSQQAISRLSDLYIIVIGEFVTEEVNFSADHVGRCGWQGRRVACAGTFAGRLMATLVGPPIDSFAGRLMATLVGPFIDTLAGPNLSPLLPSHPFP